MKKLSCEADFAQLPARRRPIQKALYCGRQFPLVALEKGTIYKVTAGLSARLNYPNRPLSRGTRVVPMSATPPPAISCFIPN